MEDTSVLNEKYIYSILSLQYRLACKDLQIFNLTGSGKVDQTS